MDRSVDGYAHESLRLIEVAALEGELLVAAAPRGARASQRSGSAAAEQHPAGSGSHAGGHYRGRMVPARAGQDRRTLAGVAVLNGIERAEDVGLRAYLVVL